jgi:hypothetical protein
LSLSRAALLVSDEAALHIVRSEMPTADAAKLYGVSEQLVRMRVNVTGARRRVSSRPIARIVPPRSAGRQAG